MLLLQFDCFKKSQSWTQKFLILCSFIVWVMSEVIRAVWDGDQCSVTLTMIQCSPSSLLHITNKYYNDQTFTTASHHCQNGFYFSPQQHTRQGSDPANFQSMQTIKLRGSEVSIKRRVFSTRADTSTIPITIINLSQSLIFIKSSHFVSSHFHPRILPTLTDNCAG